MKIPQLNHAKTPEQLRIVNDQLVALLTVPDSEGFTEQLQLLIEARDIFISSYLGQLSGEEAETFANEELKINNWLVSALTPLKSEAKADLQQLTQGKKAIKKYK